jgi:hypothetical protein
MKKIIFTFWGMLYLLQISGQDIEIEKIYEISGKAKRGNLSYAVFDEKSGTYNLTYVTKANEKMAKFETYLFDKEFNFLKLDQQELEFEKTKAVYPWWKFRGEKYETDGISADPNLFGQLVLRKYHISFSYDWFFAFYDLKYKVLDKVKLRNDAGDKYYYFTSVTSIPDSNLFVLAGLKSKDDKVSQMKNLHLLQINFNLDVVKDLEIKFDYPQIGVLLKTLFDKNSNISEFIYLFAPVKEGKNPDPQKNNYTFIRISPKLEIIDRISVNSISNYWEVNDIVKSEKNEEYYLYGPSAAGKDEYYDQLLNTTKYKAFQVAKITNHKLDYLTETFIEEFETKLKLPPSQRSSPSYNGKKFDLSDAKVLINGDLFITGQTWGGKFNAITGERELTYKDFLGFQFDPKGKLKTQFGIDAKENSGEYMAPQIVMESPTGKSLYWLFQEVKGLKGEGIGFKIMGMPQFANLLKKKLLTYPRLGKVDLASGNISEIILYGKEKYFLDNNFPIISVPSEKKLVLFGANKSGDEIWFVRIRME